jgi:diaminohydroxyphosphoribosylaminopyrimidine deaminase/5-amino-6-(5-phosphoribosylamino)uracil reductase
MSKKTDKYYINKCLKLAKKGRGYVSPNPLVGAVIVENDKIISTGFHHKIGENHAERDAISKLPEDFDFSNSTIYINLEPCTHFGKTPPCCDLLIGKKFKKVVFAMQDPNPKVAGNSIDKFKENNIEVAFGILEKKAKFSNRFFIKHIQSKKPYIIVKVAQTINGKIASFSNESKWISCEKSRKDVHKLRSKVDAVLVGTGTIRNDAPKLDVRLVKGRNPLRILLLSDLNIDRALLFNEENKGKTIIVFAKNKYSSEQKSNISSEVRVIEVSEENGKLNLEELFEILGNEGINSILVESGAGLSSYLLDKNLIDELIIYQSAKILGKGKALFDSLEIENPNQIKPFTLHKSKKIGDDLKLVYLRNHL